jgi:hypothetical protein
MVGAKRTNSVSRNSTERHCKGFESGGIVILAIILDRTTQAIKKKIGRLIRILINKYNYVEIEKLGMLLGVVLLTVSS